MDYAYYKKIMHGFKNFCSKINISDAVFCEFFEVNNEGEEK